MKKLLCVTLLGLIGVGIYFGYKALKGEGGCCGWGEASDPWSTYTPPADAGASS